MSAKWKTGGRRPRIPLTVQYAGETYKGWPSEIFKAIIRREAAEGRRLPNGWEDMVWEQLHIKYPNYIQKAGGQEKPATVSVSTIISFIQFVRRRGFNRDVVSTQEADRRALVCRECPLSSVVVGCSKCKSIVAQLVNPPDHHLEFGMKYGKPVQGCSACGCFLDLKCWIPMKYLQEEVQKHQWWEGCWMLQPEPSSSEEPEPS